MNIKRHAKARRRGGFTLVEVVIVIGLIVLLAGLVLSVSVSVVRGSEVRQTEQVLLLLDSALKEWEASAERRVSWGTGAVYDMQDGTSSVFLITELLNTAARHDKVRQIIAQINPAFVHTYHKGDYPPWISSTEQPAVDSVWAVDNTSGAYSAGLAILDTWDNPILVVHPGATYDQAVYPLLPRDDDGTVQHLVETLCGVAANRRILLVSAGPDGDLGELDKPPDTGEFEATQDNLYLYLPINR